MAGKFSWAAFAAEVLRLAPTIIADVEQDKVGFSEEGKVAAATQATLQASQLAQAIDPADTDTINEATGVAYTVISALQTPPPA
jgi:hypothetical protein